MLRDEFRLKEFEAIQEKMSHSRNDVSRAEIVYPIAIATIYAWTFTQPPEIAFLWKAAMILPVLIASLGLVRLYARHRAMRLLEGYVREIEKEIYGSEVELGWERHYAAAKPLKWLIWVRASLAAITLGATLWIAVNSGALYDEWRRVTHRETQSDRPAEGQPAAPVAPPAHSRET